MNIAITTSGFSEALTAMKHLDLDLQRKVLRKALATAAGPIVLRAKMGARRHDDSGLLADAIGVRVSVDKAGRAVANIRPYGKTVMVEQTGPDGKKRTKRTRATAYAHIVEFGSKHVSARPFMRPAADSGKGEAIAGFRAEINEALRKETAKANRKARAKLKGKR